MVETIKFVRFLHIKLYIKKYNYIFNIVFLCAKLKNG